MAHYLDANQLAEICFELGLLEANKALEAACDIAALAVANKLGIDVTVDAENAPGFGGLCVGFGPRAEGDPCPESILHFDDCSDWHDSTIAAKEELPHEPVSMQRGPFRVEG